MGGNSAATLSRLQRSDEVIRWVHSNLDSKKIPTLPNEKRLQLAAACWHTAIDHQMAVGVLVHETLHASALALMRPTIEAYVRGLWLLYAATDQDSDKAGRDQFANDFFGKIVANLEEPGRWSAASSDRLAGQYGDAPVHFLGLDSLLTNKRAMVRTKDLCDVEALARSRKRAGPNLRGR
jgi:hypothetical protein